MLKLNHIESANLSKKAQDTVRGGKAICGCACAYKDEPGGSTTDANDNANDALGLHSPGGEYIRNYIDGVMYGHWSYN